MREDKRGDRSQDRREQPARRSGRSGGRRSEPPAYVSPYARGTAGPRGAARPRGANPARALGPRDAVTTLGHRRRSPLPAIVGALVVLAIVAGGLTWWLLTRPSALALTSEPRDALITVVGPKAAGSRTTTGTYLAESLEPGTYHVTVERTGFEPLATSLELTRGDRLEKLLTLKPLPFELSFTTRPTGSTVRVTRGGKTVTGTTPCKLTVDAGDITVAIAKAGYNPFAKKVFLDATETFDLLLDPEGQLVHALGSINTKGAPKGVALTPDGHEAWSAILNGPPSIQIFDPVTAKITGSIDLGKAGAVEVIFNKAGTRAYASQMETKLGQTSKVFEMDVATRTVLRTLDTASTMTKVIALSPDEKTLYSANWAGNDVSVIDLAAGKVRERIGVAKTPRGLWPTADGKSLYVAGFDAGELERIDLVSGNVTHLFKSGGAMRHLVADEKAGKLYASDMGKDTIWVLDMKTDKVTKFASTDHKPNTIDLSPDGKVLFVSNRGANNPKSYYLPGYEWGSILLLDTATGKPLDAVVGGNQCTALDISEDGNLLVFSDFLDNRLRVYSVPGYDVLISGGGGRFAAHFADLKKKTPGKAASSGAVAD
jgi:YVTN family beta-propeller protein